MLRTRIAVLALSATTLAASGCGGSKSSSQTNSVAQTTSSAQTTPSQTTPSTQTTQPATATAPLSRAVLIARADAICRRVNARRASITIGTAPSYARYLPPLAAYEQTALGELERLTPPASVTVAWHQFLEGEHKLSETTAKVGTFAAANNLNGAHALLIASVKNESKMLAVAKHVGFKDCARTN